MPFLPLYMAELGVRDVGEIAFWSGISLGVTPAVTALLAPLWGRVADRFGAKLMLERSIASFIVIMAAMAFVTRPWQILALRALQGFFAGYGSLALAMTVQSAPPGRLAQSLAAVQTAQRLGPALGPVIGGVLAQSFGLRRAFLVSAVFYAVGLALVMVLYREPAKRITDSAQTAPARLTFRSVMAFEHFVVLMMVIFSLQFVDRSLAPILPLYVSSLGLSASQVPIISGVLFSIVAVTAAAGHHLGGPVLARHSLRATIAGGAGVAGLGVLLMMVPATATLVVSTIVFGVAVGTAMTAAYTTAGDVMPEDMRATGFGVLSSASLTAMALSPVASGFIGGHSLRAVFLVDIILLAVVVIVVHRRMDPRARPRRPVVAPEPRAPLVDEE